jgi:hypothetical protein
VIDELVAATKGGHLGSAGGRFFAWVIGGALPAALAADWLTSTWDNNAALHACGPVGGDPDQTRSSCSSWSAQISGRLRFHPRRLGERVKPNVETLPIGNVGAVSGDNRA